MGATALIAAGNLSRKASAVRRYKIAGRLWPWKYVKLKGRADGYAYTIEPGDNRGHKILIDSRLAGRRRLRIELHEFLHAAFPDIAEDVIDARSSELCRILCALGYKRK
jgi:hypothetical protein